LTDLTEKEPSSLSHDARLRWTVFKTGIGRISRWFVCSVVLAAVPIFVSFLALPRSSSVTSLLSHGDFAVLAAALAAASLGELIGPSEPPRYIRNMLALACVLLFTFTILLLAGIAGNFARLSPPLDAELSLIAFAIATVIGAASWGATVDVSPNSGPEGEPRHKVEEGESA
jgi:hypothetical protein